MTNLASGESMQLVDIDMRRLKWDPAVDREFEMSSAIIPTMYGNFCCGLSIVVWHRMTLNKSDFIELV
jgi:hypothetical protein